MSNANSWAVHGMGREEAGEALSVSVGRIADSGREHVRVDADAREGDGRDWWVGLAFQISRLRAASPSL
jgi:hypothetical protein